MFIQVRNPLTGEMSWRLVAEDYDMALEIARSNYGDMLRDAERNRMYFAALRNVIGSMKNDGKHVHVIDIGAGTGLLSMMAVTAGADQVTAMEMFQPMAHIAASVLEHNSFRDKIRLMSMRSTEISAGAIDQRANVIVAEVFDTELIGEGALRTLGSAHKDFADRCCRFVPSSARVWATPVNSEFLYRFSRLEGLNFPSPYRDCAGASAAFDIQLSEVFPEQMNLICEPFVVKRFDFEDSESLSLSGAEDHHVTVTCAGESEIHAVLMWWDLDMDGTGSSILTMEPKWRNPKSEWRDHWMQAVYFLPEPVRVKNGMKIVMSCMYDEFTFTFRISEQFQIDRNLTPSCCKCMLHTICSRYQIYRINDLNTNAKFNGFLDQAYTGKSVLCVNDGSFSSILCARFAKQVYALEYSPVFRSAILEYAKYNELNNIKIIEKDEIDWNEIDSILSEPFFRSSILPWDNLRVWSIFSTLNERYKQYNKEIRIFPQFATLRAMPVQFENLWKTSAPAGIVEGFDLAPFDDICLEARHVADATVEEHALWEYPSTCTGDVVPIAMFDLSSPYPTEKVVHSAAIIPSRIGTNALVFWMDWESDLYALHGIRSRCNEGEKPSWPYYEKQGVFFFPESERTFSGIRRVVVEAIFNTEYLSESCITAAFHFQDL